MNYNSALHLHNGDEIQIKEKGIITKVITTEVTASDVFVYVMKNGEYVKISHKEIS